MCTSAPGMFYNAFTCFVSNIFLAKLVFPSDKIKGFLLSTVYFHFRFPFPVQTFRAHFHTRGLCECGRGSKHRVLVLPELLTGLMAHRVSYVACLHISASGLLKRS